MKSKISSPRGKDVRNAVKTFNLSTDNPEDQEFLAALYRTMFLYGGTIHIKEGSIDVESGDTYYFKGATK